MKKLIVGMIAFLAVSGFAYYWFFYRITKDKAVALISSTGMSASPLTFLNTMDEKYLIAWAHAINKADTTFKVDGKTFSTKGGKQTK